MEERLRELADPGELSGLPGAGKPLPRDDDEGLGDRWAAVHVLKNANAVPAWADVRREIDERLAAIVLRPRRHLTWIRLREDQLRCLPAEALVGSVRMTRDADHRVRGEIAAAVAELDRLVARYDLMVPVPSLQIPPYTPERVFELAAGERG